MKKSFFAMIMTSLLFVSVFLPVTVHAKTPAIMTSLRNYIQAHGTIAVNYKKGSDSFTSKISYQKSGKRFLLQCTYSNGRSSSGVKMYMPVSKKKTSYTVYFNETVRASGKTAKISGSASLKRKTYSNQTTNLKFSRKNRTSVSKKIKNNAYQAAANSMLRAAFVLWERGLETGPALCFRNFGFSRIAVIDSRINTKEW